MARLNTSQIILRPMDLVLLLYLIGAHSRKRTYSELASALRISPSQAYASVQRAGTARLISSSDSDGPVPNRHALREFVLHGAKYSFPAVHGPASRGIPTGFAAPPLSDVIVQGGELPPVWPTRDGKVRGLTLYPIHAAVPLLAESDSALYELLSLFDALRAGAARERKMAIELLSHRI